MNFKVKDFGNDTECQNIDELKEALTSKYQGKSVSILIRGKFNLNKPIFVNVLGNGCLIDTYTGEEITFDQLVK